MADQPEHGRMSDTTSSHFVRQDLVPERPAPVKTTGFIGFLRTRLFNSPTNILITIVSALLLWFTDRARDQIPAGRCRLDRHGPHRLPPEESRRRGRRLLAFHSGQVLAVHLRILSGAGTLAGQPDLLSCRDPAGAAADPAAAGQGPERHPVLPGIPRHRLLPAARRRAGGLRRELDGRAVCRASTTASAMAEGSSWLRARRPP